MKIMDLISYYVYGPGRNTPRSQRRVFMLDCLICGALLLALTLSAASAQAQEETKAAAKTQSGGSLSEVGHKLANPLADLWSLSMNFETPKIFDGDVNTGDPKYGADMIFQPVMPLPLYGEGAAAWRLITRPVIPLIFSQPIPTGFNEFDNKSGIGDIQLPAILSLPDKYAGKWILGAGPVGMFPSATDDALGSDQWSLGPAVVVGYKTKSWTAVLFPNYFWKIGASDQDDDTPDVNRGSLLYSQRHCRKYWSRCSL